jgi:hypothetical protein
VAAADLIQQFLPYSANGSGSKVTRQRLAADTITYRSQDVYPAAYRIGDTATVVVRRQSGALETYTIKWDKFGTPLTQAGNVPNFSLATHTAPRLNAYRRHTGEDNPWGVWTGDAEPAEPEEIPAYLRPIADLQNLSGLMLPEQTGFGSRSPVFSLPPGYTARLGSKSADLFTSGTFTVGAHTIGFIRIWTMSPTSTTTALQQFAAEIVFFQQSTDALVIDVMHNGGGSACYTQSLATYLIPQPFHGGAMQLRATQVWVENLSSTLWLAKLLGVDQATIDGYSKMLSMVQDAMAANRGSAGPLPICGTTITALPATDRTGANLAYTKPILLLTDAFSLSAAEHLTAMLQDAHRATVFGTRTAGGGGSPTSFNATTYSEGVTRITETLILRSDQVQTPDYPSSNYIENTGVYPDVVQDYMTADNLLNKGTTFVQQFSTEVEKLIAAQ